MFSRITFILAFTFCLAGCGIVGRYATKWTHKPYHTTNPVEVLVHPSDSISLDIAHPTIGYLEFDDQGEPWREPGGNAGGKTQLQAVVHNIRAQGADTPMRTVVFVHGWNNNGMSENLDGFRSTLWHLQAADPETRVFGVYVSWRGMVAPFPTYVDVGNREAAAGRIGSGPMLASLVAISDAAHKNPAGRMTLIGHSYGAKMVASLTSHYLATRVTEKGSVKPLADLTILVNTAENGIVARHAIGMMLDFNLKYQSPNQKMDLPLVVVLGSSKDIPVKRLLPLWNHLVRDVFTNAFPHKAGEVSSDVQAKSIYRGMGFVESIRSHRFVESNNTDSTYALKNANTINEAWQCALKVNAKHGQDWARNSSGNLRLTFYPNENSGNFQITDDYILEDTLNPNNPTPYWLAEVPDFVVNGHGDIWNPNFYGIIAALDAAGSPPPEAVKTAEAAIRSNLPPPSSTKPNLKFTKPM